MAKTKLSIIMPVYNEEKTVLEIIKRVKSQELPDVEKELIVIDDGSSDETSELLKSVKGVTLISYRENRGKGYAIRRGLEKATGNIVLIQDADLELSPEDYPALIAPIIEKKASVVYGSRLLGRKWKGRFSPFYLGGRFVTFVANLLYGVNITDEPNGYKVFKAEIIRDLNLRCERFEFCPEVTAKVAKKGLKIHEVPVKFTPRTFEEGKKLNVKDGVEAVWTLLKYKFKN